MSLLSGDPDFLMVDINTLENKKIDPPHKWELGKMVCFLSSVLLTAASKLLCSLNEACECV